MAKTIAKIEKNSQKEKNKVKTLTVKHKEESGKALLLKELREGEAGMLLIPAPMEKLLSLTSENKEIIQAQLTGIHNFFPDEKKRERFIMKVFSEMFAGAYQDMLIAYCLSPVESGSLDGICKVQEIRHKQDRHLISVMQAFKDINRQPLKVTIKQADNVNIGDQANIDKQLNVSSNDLDKKNR